MLFLLGDHWEYVVHVWTRILGHYFWSFRLRHVEIHRHALWSRSEANCLMQHPTILYTVLPVSKLDCAANQAWMFEHGDDAAFLCLHRPQREHHCTQDFVEIHAGFHSHSF